MTTIHYEELQRIARNIARRITSARKVSGYRAAGKIGEAMISGKIHAYLECLDQINQLIVKKGGAKIE